jgi:FMN phosphatase YigB (HAD superfamily)
VSLGVRLDECVFTDDREEYIEGAQHVGMKTIFFTGTEQFKTELEEMLLLDKS